MLYHPPLQALALAAICTSVAKYAAGQCRNVPVLAVAIAVAVIATVLLVDGHPASADGGIPRETIGVEMANGTTACAISASALLRCWEWSGDEAVLVKNMPRALQLPQLQFVQLSMGDFACALTDTGDVYCWGTDNSYGQLYPPKDEFIQISVGGHHACGVRSDNRVVCWGNDTHGQSSPTLGKFVYVGIGRFHSCAIAQSSELVCWGNDDDGQSSPPEGLFKQVSAGEYHSCGLRTSGTVQCWGRYQAAPDGSFVWISSGYSRNCGVTTSGNVQCWNVDGSQSLPQVGQGSHVQVATASRRSCSIRTSGAVTCWDGEDNRRVPAQLAKTGATLQPTTINTNVRPGDADSVPVFRLIPHARKVGPTGGTVTSSAREVESGGTITVTARPDPGFLFVRWEGDANGSSNPLTITLDDHMAVTAVFSPIATTPATKATSVDGRIIARLLADGRIEFGFEPEGGEQILPRSRYFPATAGGGWLASSDVVLNGEQLGRITARRLADGRVEFGFIPANGERILPSSRYFPASASVGRWLRSSVIGLE